MQIHTTAWHSVSPGITYGNSISRSNWFTILVSLSCILISFAPIKDKLDRLFSPHQVNFIPIRKLIQWSPASLQMPSGFVLGEHWQVSPGPLAQLFWVIFTWHINEPRPWLFLWWFSPKAACGTKVITAFLLFSNLKYVFFWACSFNHLTTHFYDVLVPEYFEYVTAMSQIQSFGT